MAPIENDWPWHILGGGGHGQDCADIAAALFGAHGPDVWDDHRDDARGTIDEFRTTWRHSNFIIGVNDPATRREIAQSLAEGSTPARLIHPSATISPSAELSPGVVVGAGTQIGPDTVLGPHVHVGPGCTVTRTTVGAFTTISPGVHIAGDVTIGEGCLIGVGAVVSNLITVGDRATIGAGAVVVRPVADGETVVTRQLVATAT